MCLNQSEHYMQYKQEHTLLNTKSEYLQKFRLMKKGQQSHLL